MDKPYRIKKKYAMQKKELAKCLQCGQSNGMTATAITVPMFRSIKNQIVRFSSAKWNPYAGRAGGYQAESACGCFVAIAEHLGDCLQFWLLDAETGETLEELQCES